MTDQQSQTTAAEPVMLVVTLQNRARRPLRFFASSVSRAVELALECHMAQRGENLRVMKAQQVCPSCFPNEGAAAWRAAPKPQLWFAAGTAQRHSKLHLRCTADGTIVELPKRLHHPQR